MNNISATPTQNLPNLVTPFAPPSKNQVGLEARDLKDSVLPPVEESSQSYRGMNRRVMDEAPEREKVLADEEDEASAEQSSAEAEELEKQAIISQLAARDREVRQHEAVHAAVGGALAGAPQFNYVRGPDGVMYANAGEVPIKLPTNSADPEVQLRHAEQVQRAALAPDNPSSQDRRVAAQAAQIAQQARADIAAQKLSQSFRSEEQGESSVSPGDSSVAVEMNSSEAVINQYQDQQLMNQDSVAPFNNDVSRRFLSMEQITKDVEIGQVLNRRV